MKKVVSNDLTAKMLNKKFKSAFKEFIAQNKVSSFMNNIK